MALYTKSDFAKHCGLTTGNLTNYIKRNKVLMSGDYIDDQEPINKEFLEKRKAKAELKYEPPAPPKLRMIRPDPGTPDLPEAEEDDDDTPPPAEEDNAATLYKQKLKADIDKKHREIALLKLREEKIRGEVVPVDIITNVFRAHTQSIVTAQKDGIEELLINLSVEARLKGEQLARLRGKMVDILNKAVDKAAYTSQKNLKTILEQLSVKKEVGEHG